MGKTFNQVYGNWEGFCKKTTKNLYYRRYFKNKHEAKRFYKFMLSRNYLGDSRFLDDATWVKSWDLVEEIRKKNDNLICVVGREGAGKSHFAKILASVLDPNFKTEKILYKPDNLPDLLENAKKGDCLLFDEGAMFLHNADFQSKIAKQLTKLFTMMRITGMHIIICIPSFFILQKYVRQQRTKILFNVYERGKFRCYKRDAITKISSEGEKSQKIERVTIPYEWFYEGRCGPNLPKVIDDEEYEDRKGDNFKEFLSDLRTVLVKEKQQEEKKSKIKVAEVCRRVGLARPTVLQHINKGFLVAEKIDRDYYIDEKNFESYKKIIDDKREKQKILKEKPKTAKEKFKQLERLSKYNDSGPKINGVDKTAYMDYIRRQEAEK